MKKLITFFFIVFAVCFTINAYANDIYDISIEMQIGQNKATFNGENTVIDENEHIVPFIENGRTLVPLRFVADKLGLYVEWIQETRNVVLNDADREIILTVDDNTVYFNGVEYELDISPIIENDRTFVPARFVSEALQCNVLWEEETKKVYIKREKEVEIDINSDEVQKLFSDILNQKEFASYYSGYCDIETLDSPLNLFGGTARQLFAILRFDQFEEEKYTKKEAEKVIMDFLSHGDISKSESSYNLESLKKDLEAGANYGSDSKEELLVAVYDGKVLDDISIELFGEPLPEHGNLAYYVAYHGVYLFNAVNLYYPYSKTLPYIVYYNAASDKYLFTKFAEDIMNFEDDEKLEFDEKLVKATEHNGKISLYIQRCSILDGYSEPIKNTYQKCGDGYYWISSFTMGKGTSVNESALINAEKNALKYIAETYPDFNVVDINVVYNWLDSTYEVEYDDGNNDIRNLILDNSGENVKVDFYLEFLSENILK